MSDGAIRPGAPLPLGVSRVGDGVNFAVFSRHAAGARLLLFDDATSHSPTLDFRLDPARHRSGDVWHIWVAGVGLGRAYAWRMTGPAETANGDRFDRDRNLLDPRATAIASSPDDAERAPCAVLADESFDWQDDAAPRVSWQDTVIYETHLRGFTIHPSSGVAKPGTFLGLVEKIPYLKRLGVTAVELMPVQEFPDIDRSTGTPRRNYWGYDPVAPFAAKASYSSDGTPQSAIDEFKTMVRELHAAGLELILDIVLNHTAEGGEDGPTFGWRGFDNRIYYLLAPDGAYRDFTGCRNTLNCNHPVVQDYIIDCLRHWVVEMHVDGFRLDLAAVLARLSPGAIGAEAPLLDRIAEDPILRGTKLIAEPWDAVGGSIGRGFAIRGCAEWNSQFRDDLRRFWRGDTDMIGPLATRLCGSADLYQRSAGTPLRGVNFVTAHDGFTLFDLVSYRHKRNEANGAGGRDGRDDELSDNCGIEGACDDAAIERLRLRRMKNFVATLLVSRGVPMLLGGDEFCRSQGGNSNPWGQDAAISWYDWRLLARHAEMTRFVRLMIAFRRRHAVLRRAIFYTAADIRWFGRDGQPPSWSSGDLTLGCIVVAEPSSICLLFNSGAEKAAFVLPSVTPAVWHLFADTSLPAPQDIHDGDDCLSPVADGPLVVARNSMVILLGT